MSELPVSPVLNKVVNKELLRTISVGVNKESSVVLFKEGLSSGSFVRVSKGVLTSDRPLDIENDFLQHRR
jgi:hypothetical protein